jgi:hypothetical protein
MFKKLFSVLVFAVMATARLAAQDPCNLINSATFSVPNIPVTASFGRIPSLDENAPNKKYMPLDIQQWQYIAITKNSNGFAKIYKNGQLVYQGTYQNLFYSWNRLDLGAVFYTNWHNWFNGAIDEVRLSNIVRSEADIASYYNANLPFTTDANTTGLWHFDQSSGSNIIAAVGNGGSITNATWTQGKFGNCLSYNGVSSRASINQSIPTSNFTFEFWIKPFDIHSSWPVSWFGTNTSGFSVSEETQTPSYIWSNGATGSSVTVNPSQVPYVWVSNGICNDTIFFNSATSIVYDTSYIAVTDTLIINTITGLTPPNNINVIKVFPNPSSTHITVDFGDYSLLSGFSLKITNSTGQLVYYSLINAPSSFLSLAGWGGSGLYYIQVINQQGQVVDNKKIILQ